MKVTRLRVTIAGRTSLHCGEPVMAGNTWIPFILNSAVPLDQRGRDSHKRHKKHKGSSSFFLPFVPFVAVPFLDGNFEVSRFPYSFNCRALHPMGEMGDNRVAATGRAK